ncbi:MAG: DNA alkylation repair protein [Bryobacteraceae bacterium]
MSAGGKFEARRKLIRERLQAAARPEVLASMQRLVPNAKMLGVKVPEIRAIAAGFAKDDPLAFSDTLAFFDVLCIDNLREEILVGTFLMSRHKKQLATIPWAAIDRWLDHVDNWETCDQLASNVVAAAVAANSTLRSPLRELTRSANVWRRRFAIATAASLNQHGRFFPELTLAICQDLMGDSEPMVRKAVGWAIRELSKKDEDLAFDFVLENQARMPRTLVREASEKMSEERRQRLLK